ncbi:hypothetical protein DSL92_01040 [Billgrantia gudaonensis]|uniref:Uncharacterized protein n=1 Tax=Billgrantia gudaonensis TaxID=376427 RepID=A0A3S0QGH8_9GAMM|nr:hypothetical protein DSL92_01040 [Halomonas gudaonensis]
MYREAHFGGLGGYPGWRAVRGNSGHYGRWREAGVVAIATATFRYRRWQYGLPGTVGGLERKRRLRGGRFGSGGGEDRTMPLHLLRQCTS